MKRTWKYQQKKKNDYREKQMHLAFSRKCSPFKWLKSMAFYTIAFLTQNPINSGQLTSSGDALY